MTKNEIFELKHLFDKKNVFMSLVNSMYNDFCKGIPEFITIINNKYNLNTIEIRVKSPPKLVFTLALLSYICDEIGYEPIRDEYISHMKEKCEYYNFSYDEVLLFLKLFGNELKNLFR